MEPGFRAALSHAVARVTASRFAKPAARVAFGAAGLALLAFIGRTAVAGALSASAIAPATVDLSAAAATSTSSAAAATPSSSTPPAGNASPPSSRPNPASAPALDVPAHTRASPDDPVVLNSATEGDLRRLPGIGAKRAEAILALRARLGRLRAVEDLLKVKGVGRATLRRLRPLVRLDALPPDAGSAAGRR